MADREKKAVAADERPAALGEAESRKRRPYRKPRAEWRGQIKPSLLGSPPDPP